MAHGATEPRSAGGVECELLAKVRWHPLVLWRLQFFEGFGEDSGVILMVTPMNDLEKKDSVPMNEPEDEDGAPMNELKEKDGEV